MASGYLVCRGVLTVGIHCQNVCRNVLFTQTRDKKRWAKAYALLMERKLKIEGPPPPRPRSQQPNWDYHAEVQAFGTRLHESFSLELLKTAFVHPSYLRLEQERRRSVGIEPESAALALRDHGRLSEEGQSFSEAFLADWCRAIFPGLPPEGAAALVGHLTGLVTVSHVARNLGVEELTMCGEFPVPDEVLRETFMAVVGALRQGSGPERAGLFLRDFLVTQLIGKDLFEVWSVVNPMGLLVEEMTRRGLPLPEPRITRTAGAGTALPIYFVGLYSDRKLLAEAPGETVFSAEEEASRVALRKLYGFAENRRPLDFSTPRPAPPLTLQAVSSG